MNTFLTYSLPPDFQHVKAEGQSKPLNIVILSSLLLNGRITAAHTIFHPFQVIKLSKINGQDCVKISDEITKVRRYSRALEIQANCLSHCHRTPAVRILSPLSSASSTSPALLLRSVDLRTPPASHLMNP